MFLFCSTQVVSVGAMFPKPRCCGSLWVKMQRWSAAIPRVLPITRCTGTGSCLEKQWNSSCSRRRLQKTTTLGISVKRNSQRPRLNLREDRSQWRTWRQKTKACTSALWVNTVMKPHGRDEQKPPSTSHLSCNHTASATHSCIRRFTSLVMNLHLTPSLTHRKGVIWFLFFTRTVSV